MNTLSKGVLVALGLVTLASCGGGGDIAAGGTGGTGISQGPITGFGSVFVNGVKFEDTAATRIEVEDNESGTTRANLKVGMVVKVAWTKDAAGNMTVTKINFGDDVQGPVGVVTVAVGGDSTFAVLGQSVMTHAVSTVFDGVADAAALAAMPATTIVEISGLRDGAGIIHATRIEVKAGETELELKGIASVASASGLFTLGAGSAAIVVNYSGTPAVAVGACVEVKSITGISVGQLMASEVQLDDDCTAGGNEGQELELKGFPSAITATTFTVNGQSVNYSGATFSLGTSAANLVGSSVVIEVEGSLVNGVLVAKKISFEIEGANEAEGSAGGSIAADGTFSVTLSEAVPVLPLGPTSFTVDNQTVYEDKSVTPIVNFGRANVTSSQILKVYYRVEGGIKIATRIKREG